MSQSWGHTVRLLTDDEIEHFDRQLEMRQGQSGARYYRCGTKGCDSPCTHYVGYRYVTGRAGRVSSAEKRACPIHAQAFADRHDVEMPVGPSERVVRQWGEVWA